MAHTCDLDEQKPLIANNVNSTDDSQQVGDEYTKQPVMKTIESGNIQEDSFSLIDETPNTAKHVNFIDKSSTHVPERPDGTVLSYEQAATLITTLENTKIVIQQYIQTLENGGQTTPTPRRKSWWGLHCWPQKRRWLYRYITIVTITLQFLNLLILSMLDAWPKQKEWPYVVASSVTMIILQLINLFFLILASGRLVKQIYRNSVNSMFLAQTYGATILLFAGLYTLTYRLQRKSWRFVNENLYEDPIQVFVLYAKFLFYSISTATLCGSDNVLPEEWFNCLFAGFQMLLSFCYFASILGAAMCHDNTRPTANPTTSSPALSLTASLQKQASDSYLSHQHQHHCHHNYHSCNGCQQQQHHECFTNKEEDCDTKRHQVHLPNHRQHCCNLSSSFPTGSNDPISCNRCVHHTEHTQIQKEKSRHQNMDEPRKTTVDSFSTLGGEVNPTFSQDASRIGCPIRVILPDPSPLHTSIQTVEAEVVNLPHPQTEDKN